VTNTIVAHGRPERNFYPAQCRATFQVVSEHGPVENRPYDGKKRARTFLLRARLPLPDFDMPGILRSHRQVLFHRAKDCMGVSSSSGEQNVAATPTRVSAGAMLVVVAGICAAWFAAGSAGMFARPLQIAMTWLALGVAIVAGCVKKRGLSPFSPDNLILAGSVLIGLLCASTADPVAGALSVALVLAMIGRCLPGLDGRVVLLSSLAAAVLGIFRLASTAIPAIWCLANGIGRAFGWLVGAVVQQPLDVGATFGGVDFLVLMAVLYVGWLRLTERPRLNRAIIGAVAILAAQFVYLTVLAYSEYLSSLIPVVATSVENEPRLVLWTWNESLRAALPWNLPLLAVVLQAIVAAAMFRWAKWLPLPEEESAEERKVRYSRQEGSPNVASTQPPLDRLLWIGPAVLAIAVPLIVALPLKFGRSDLSDKNVLAYDQGFAQWEPPAYYKADPPAARMFGMLPTFVESLGGTFERSKELSQEELDRAEVLLLVHPDQPLPADRLERVQAWVRGGGSLLVATSPQFDRRDAQQAVNALLDGTAMAVNDAAVKSAAENWEQSCQPMAHPAAAGVSDWRNRFGLSLGASVDTHWPARPILAGRFAFVAGRLAWETPGTADALPKGAKYVPGAKLGDIVLAAEQRLGDGRIVLLADTTPLSDDGNVAAYEFTGRLLDYLANRGDCPQAVWRQMLGLLAAVVLVAFLAWRPSAWRMAVPAALLAVSWVGCIALSHAATEVLPDGRRHKPNNVAYIDASHLEAYSDRPGDDYGLRNFARTLMRNGYLPLMLPKVSEERLERAGLLISIAPARPFSAGEREVVSEFIKKGHTLLCMVGAEQSATSNPLLVEYEMSLGFSPVPPGDDRREPEPLGAWEMRVLSASDGEATPAKGDAAKAAKRADAKMRYMDIRFFAAWPVAHGPDALAWVYDTKQRQAARSQSMLLGKPGQPALQSSDSEKSSDSVEQQAVVVSKRHGAGAVVVIGDTYFAINQNLLPPSATGQPPENAVFWRWLLSRVTDITDGKPWDPPPKTANAAIKENDQLLEPDDEDKP
jgi:hypothetical protein